MRARWRRRTPGSAVFRARVPMPGCNAISVEARSSYIRTAPGAFGRWSCHQVSAARTCSAARALTSIRSGPLTYDREADPAAAEEKRCRRDRTERSHRADYVRSLGRPQTSRRHLVQERSRTYLPVVRCRARRGRRRLFRKLSPCRNSTSAAPADDRRRTIRSLSRRVPFRVSLR